MWKWFKSLFTKKETKPVFERESLFIEVQQASMQQQLLLIRPQARVVKRAIQPMTFEEMKANALAVDAYFARKAA